MISIIIPIYNQADKLSDCLLSIIKQDYKDYEVIIVSDGSTDNVEEAVNSFKDKLPLQFYAQDKQMGAPAARNFGFGKSRGEYLFFCDADAVLESNALSLMLKTLEENSGASYVYSSFLWGKKLFQLGPFDAEKLKTMPYIHTMSLIRREHFPKNGWDESIKKFQDWDLWLSMLKEGRRGVWIDKVLFRIKPGGIISSWLPSFAYKILPFLPSVKRYNKAVSVLKKKHNLGE